MLCGNMGLGQHDVVCLRGPLSNNGKYRWWNAQDHQQIEHALRGVLEFVKKRGPFQILLGVGQAAQIVVGLSARASAGRSVLITSRTRRGRASCPCTPSTRTSRP